MFAPKIKLDKDLYDRLCKAAKAAGYSSVDEFAAHVLEKAAAGANETTESEEAVRKRLQGLGYLQ